jgi:hypothetical protein
MGSRISFNNLEYASEFLKYLIDHPEEAERIPDGAVIHFRAEVEDPGFSAILRAVAKASPAFHGRIVVPVGVQESQGAGARHSFVFPWSISHVWLRLDPVDWIQEPLSACLGRQPTEATRYIGMERPVVPVPRLQYSAPATTEATK